MITKYITTIALLSLILTGCQEETQMEQTAYISKGVTLKMGFTSTLEDTPTSEISAVDVYSFRKKTERDEYTLEKVYPSITPQDNNSEKNIEIVLDGSLERVLYLVANKQGEVPFTARLNANTTESEFKKQMILHNDKGTQSPILMIARQNVPATLSGNPLKMQFDYALACLDIDNQYEDFNIDSLVVKEAVCGTILFTPETPTQAQVERAKIKFDNTKQIYLYQTDASVLAIYGKYKDIPAVFDIPLTNIKKTTRYKVTLKGDAAPAVNMENKLIWNIIQWKDGTTIESSPDWTDNNNKL